MVAWLHIQRTALPSVLHPEDTWDIIVLIAAFSHNCFSVLCVKWTILAQTSSLGRMLMLMLTMLGVTANYRPVCLDM